MDIDKFGIGQVEVKNEYNDSSEAFQIDAVKSEPSEIYSFTKLKSHFNSSSCETDFVDHEFASANTANYQDQNEKEIDVKNLNQKDFGHSKLSENLFTSKCYSVKNIKKEDIDIFYEDIKREQSDEKSNESIRFCKVCDQSFYGETDSFKSTRQCSCQKLNESLSYSIHAEDVVPDVKPSNFDLTTGVGLQPLEVQDEIISGDEGIEEQDSSAIHRRSVSPLENDDKIKCKRFSCQTCGRQYKYKAGVNQHRRYECHKEASFSCGKCPFRTKTKSNLTRHLVYQHSRNKS